MKKTIILIVLLLVAFNGQSQEYKDEISVVFFTASFAKTKEITDWKKLYDCNKHILNIEDQPDLMAEESISVVPTIKTYFTNLLPAVRIALQKYLPPGAPMPPTP